MSALTDDRFFPTLYPGITLPFRPLKKIPAREEWLSEGNLSLEER